MECLLYEGWSIRVLVRDASKLEASVRQRVEVVEGEVESEGARVERRCGTLNRLGRDDGHMRTVLKVMAKQRRNP